MKLWWEYIAGENVEIYVLIENRVLTDMPDKLLRLFQTFYTYYVNKIKL